MNTVLKIAIPSPLRRAFDYLPPKLSRPEQWLPGVRVKVPFGTRHVTGILLEVQDGSEVDPKRLKHAEALLDSTPLLPKPLFDLALWATQYYHHPVGDGLQQFMPILLRQGHSATLETHQQWQLTASGSAISPDTLKRSPKQAEILELFTQYPHGIGEALLKSLGISLTQLRPLIQKGWLARHSISTEAHPTLQLLSEPNYHLNSNQQTALDFILNNLSSFNTFLLEGITGSGKTEVYLQAIQRILELNKQVLILVPEIGLTPQMATRIKKRFSVPVALLHSGLTDKERLQA